MTRTGAPSTVSSTATIVGVLRSGLAILVTVCFQTTATPLLGIARSNSLMCVQCFSVELKITQGAFTKMEGKGR